MNNAQATYLDLLRGIAAQLVLLGHIYSLRMYPDSTLGIGDLGVIIFFVLSGFLVTYTSMVKINRGGYSSTDYYFERFFRIFVPYLPAIAVIFVLDFYSYNYAGASDYIEHFNLKDLIATLTMMQQHPSGLFMDKIFGASEMKLATFGSARPLWTVANEWWLYIVFGLVVFYPKSRKNYFIWSAVFLIAAIVPLFNSVAGTGQGLSLVWILMSGLAYVYYQQGKNIENSMRNFISAGVINRILIFLILCGLLLLLLVRFVWISYIEPGFVFMRPIFYDFNTYVLLMIFFIVIYILLGGESASKRNKISKFVADYSYSLYLIHYTWIFFCISVDFTVGERLLDFVLLYVTSNILAIGLWWAFERNYKRVKQVVYGMFSNRLKQ